MMQDTAKNYRRDMMPLDTPAIARDVAVGRVLEQFDFGQVHRALTALNGTAPTLEQMRAETENILCLAYDTYPKPEPWRQTWNGFQAWRSPGTKGHWCSSGSLTLRFVVSEARETPEPADASTSNRDAAILSVMQHFDFERVHQVMTALDWGWYEKGVPTLETLKSKAAEMLAESWEDFPGEVCISTGGLTSWRSPGQIDNVKCPQGLELEFVLVSQWADLTPPK
jgi:hypothetical protein